MAILRGVLPVEKNEMICGIPNCPCILKHNAGRLAHWRKEHKDEKCPLHNTFNEIFDMFGIDVVTETHKADTIGYITTPLIKCPIKGCSFSAHQVVNM